MKNNMRFTSHNMAIPETE